MDEQIELRDFIEEQYNRIEAYIKESQDIDYFKMIGLALTIFTIFEYSMGEIFNDFRNYILGRNDGISKLQRLPIRALSKILASDGGKLPWNLETKTFLDFLKNTGTDFYGRQNEISKKIEEYYTFTHFNTKSRLGIEKIDDIFFNQLFLEDNSRNKFFSDLEIEFELDSDFSFSNIQRKKATDYINEYSEKVRHIIAHKLPFQGGESEIDEAFFNNVTEYSPKYAVEIFNDILLRLYDEYVQLHNHKIMIDNQRVSGQEYSFGNL